MSAAVVDCVSNRCCAQQSPQQVRETVRWILYRHFRLYAYLGAVDKGELRQGRVGSIMRINANFEFGVGHRVPFGLDLP